MKKPINERKKQSRSVRLAKKFKGALRCEWCNRWTPIPMKKWLQLFHADALFPAKYTYFCYREHCKMERAALLPDD